MALNSSGPIGLIGNIVGQSIELELGGTGTTQLSLFDSTVRTLLGKVSGPVDMFSGYSKSNIFYYTFASNQNDINLNSFLTSQGWNGSIPVVITINGGVVISASSTGSAGLTVSGSYPNGLSMINNGYILGMGGGGGSGGAGGAGGSDGASGGTALSVSTYFTMTNNGIIAGGGGGGGGGGAIATDVYWGAGYGGGGGGGRTGNSNSGGGYGAGGNSVSATYGGTGTFSGAGGGGTGGGDGPYSGIYSYGEWQGANGGSGGSWGASGVSGDTSGNAPGTTGGTLFYGGVGGAGGAAIVGSGYISWVATGTTYGAVS